jgi:hypothetical protein
MSCELKVLGSLVTASSLDSYSSSCNNQVILLSISGGGAVELSKTIHIKDVFGKVFSFNDLNLFRSFATTEKNFWKRQSEALSISGIPTHPNFQVHEYFEKALEITASWPQSIPSWDANAFHAQIDSLYNNHLRNLPSHWLHSANVCVPKWIEIYRHNPEWAARFLSTIANHQTGAGRPMDEFIGDVLAYEFLLQDESVLAKRRAVERQSFHSIRSDLLEQKDGLVAELSDLRGDWTAWKDAKQKEITDWQAERVNHSDNLALFMSNSFHERMAQWNKAFQDLQDTYQEKLRLDSPASYWADAATKFRDQGLYWTAALVIIALGTIVFLSLFFISWLTGQQLPIQLSTLEGVIIFASILSIVAVLLKVFGRLIFSSFHLQRDAEEREQLTHLYLALTNVSTVDEDTRKIVLQALFSRSETGLLSNESGPTMPGNVLETILQATKK